MSLDSPISSLPPPEGYVFELAWDLAEIFIAEDGSRYQRRFWPDREKITQEWWLDDQARKHRGGGLPAQIERDRSGVVASMQWHVDGRRSRLDGPACSYGPGVSELWFLDDIPQANRFELAQAAVSLRGRVAEREVECSVFSPLLLEGAGPRDVLAAVGHGVTTIEGARALLRGAPVEWVLAFEAGRES